MVQRKITSKTEPTPQLLRMIANTPDDGQSRRRYVWQFVGIIEVDDTWVMDGFDLTPERLNELLQNAIETDIGYARPDEVSGKGVLTHSPAQVLIRTEQGYPAPA